MFNKYTRLILTILLFLVFLVSGGLIRNHIMKKYSSNDEYVLKKFPSINKFLSINQDEVLVPSFENGVFVHFWATWCGPCEAELPEFIEYSKKFPRSSFLIVASKDDIKLVKKTIDRIGVNKSNLYYLFDESGSVMKSFGTLKLPETYLFDSNRDIIKKFVGPQDWKNDYFYKNFSYLNI